MSRQAAQNIRKPSWETTLRRWWCRKYRRTWKSEEFGLYTLDELLLEFFEDYYEAHPSKIAEALQDEHGNIRLSETGDPLIDKWEEEIARGMTPDLEEGMDEMDRRRLHADRAGDRPAETPDGDDGSADLPEHHVERFDLPDRPRRGDRVRGAATPEWAGENLIGAGDTSIDEDELLEQMMGVG